MSFLHSRTECLTGCQDSRPWSPETDLQYDFVMVYGTDADMPQRIRLYREKGYTVHLMTGSAWGEYQDYLNGEWDGADHWDESQLDRSGTPILHGVNVPYLCPTLSFCRYLTQKLLPAIDAGAEAIHLEEPEFWDAGGYSPAFQREYESFYGERWQPPHLSCETRYKASALKVHLYKRLVAYVSRELKAHARERYGRELPFYVPTHSLVNYTQWKILSPEATLLDIPTVDGCIAQVWTGTARAGSVYRGRYDERTFETAFLEYGVMQELVRGTGRRMWFLHDPIEDNPEYTWEDFRRNYLKTLIASLLHPAVHHYEVMPWPTRIFNGIYPKKSTIGSGIRPGEAMKGAKPIPPEYAELLCAMVQTLGDMDQPCSGFEDRNPSVGIFMADSALYQRTFPDPVPHTVSGTDGLNHAFLQLLRRQKQGECTAEETRHLMEQIAADNALFNDYTASGSFPHFFGMAMPLVKAGVPLRPVQLENAVRYSRYLQEYDVLILSYEFLKPFQPAFHTVLAEWVLQGGTLICVGDGADPYHQVQGWWNSPPLHFENPLQHLFTMLGLPRDPGQGIWSAGKGCISLYALSPAGITLSGQAAQDWLNWVKAAVPGIVWRNRMLMRRGPYCIAAVMEESPSNETLVLKGSFADLFTSRFELLTEKHVHPGENALLFDLNTIRGERIRIIGSSARIDEFAEQPDRFTLSCKAAAGIQVHIRLKLPSAVSAAAAADETGAVLPVQCEWDSASSTVLLSFPSTNRQTQISLFRA